MSTQFFHMSLEIPTQSEFVAPVRLAVSGVASQMGFRLEDIEDIKVSLSEACTNAIQHAYPSPESEHRIKIDLYIYKAKLEILISDEGVGFDLSQLGTAEQKEKSMEKYGLGLGLTFIKSLMDETDFYSEEGVGTRIRMVKNLAS